MGRKPMAWYDERGRRWCSGCQAYNPVEWYGVKTSGRAGDGLDEYCRAHRREAGRRSYRRHPAYYIAKATAAHAATAAGRRRYRSYQRRYGRELRAQARTRRRFGL